jgi:hypothetical protein
MLTEEEGVKKLLHSLVNVVKCNVELHLTNCKVLINVEDDPEYVETVIKDSQTALKSFPLAKERMKDIRCVTYRNLTMTLTGVYGESYETLYKEYKRINTLIKPKR